MEIKLSSNEEWRRSDSQSMQAISIRAGDVSHMVKSAEHASFAGFRFNRVHSAMDDDNFKKA